MLSDSSLPSVVTSRVNIDQDRLPVDRRIDRDHRSDAWVRKQTLSEKPDCSRLARVSERGGKNPSGSCKFASEPYHYEE